MLWAGIVAIFTLPIVHLLVWSLKLRVDLVWLGAFSGGLVGFVAILPLSMHLPHLLASSEAWAAIMMLAVGPGITIPLGQIGGALGGVQARKRATVKDERHRNLVAIGWRVTPIPTNAADTSQDAAQPHFQFRIFHLLWIGVWLSLLLTLIRLSGIPYRFVLPMLVGGLAYQALSLWVGRLLARWLRPWWNRRWQIRST